jgi:hypothetical protein
VIRAVSVEPQLVRSWAVGGAPLDPEYVWNQTAQIWQTSGAGERLMDNLSATQLAGGLAATGVPKDDAGRRHATWTRR